MNKITVPLQTDAAVADLQDALQQILERGVILRDDEGARRELSAALKREHSEQMYGEATRKLVSIFQEERRLEVSGGVDEATANAINVLLREWELLEQSDDAHRPFVVSGQLRREDGLAVHGVRVRAFHESDRGGISLGEGTADAEGRYTMRYELLRGTASINLRVSVTDEDGRLLHQSDVIRGAKPLEIVDLTLPMARKPVTQDWEEPMAKNANKTFCITGRVIDSTTQQGVAGLRVGAWDKEMICDDLVSSTVTDEQGAFQMEFTDSHFKELCQDRQPDLFFKVFRENELIKSTEDSVLWNIATGNTEVVIEVDIPAAGKPEDTFVVRGNVRDADGSLLGGVVVKAFDKDLRRKQWLGQATTNNTGEYEIRYSDQQFCRAEKGNADLVVKAVAADGSLLAASPVLFNAPPSATVDLTIPAEVLLPPTLFEKIGLALVPLLEGLKVEELEEDEEDKEHQDLSFLSGETGFDKPTLARFVLAHKLAQQRIHADFMTDRPAQQGIRAEFWFVLLGGSFYQFTEDQSLKEQLATVLGTLPSLDAAAVRKALTRGFNQKEIPEPFREDVPGWIEAFLKLIASRLVSGPGEPTFVKLALEHANITGAAKQETFARLFNEHKALTPEVLAALENDPSFKKEEIADLRTSFRLAELTRADFSVVKMIKEGFGVRQPDQIRSLARKSESEWVNFVKEKYAAGDIKLPIEVGGIAGQIELPAAEVYGKTLERQFREAFPTTAFAGGLARALHNGGAHGLPHAEALDRFLESHEEFELLNTPVDDVLQNNIDGNSRTLAEDEDFRLEVKAVQRVFKLAPTFEATDALLANDVHSAQQVYRLGENEFVRRYADRPGFTLETARLAWNRAADTHAAVLTVVADLKALEADALPLALHNGNEAVATFPNWNNLFKTGGLCECEHCRSVLGPAAYFADLLMFLKDRKSRKPIPIFGSLDYYSVKAQGSPHIL